MNKRIALWSAKLSTLPLLLLACESGDSGKSWAEFSRCMIGDGIEDSTQVPARLRSIELKERQPPALWDAKTQWPGRCEPYAAALYSSLGSSTEHKLLKRSLKGQLDCKEEEAAGCGFSPKGEILPAAKKLWDLAANASLAQSKTAEVPVPKFDVQLQSPKEWKPLVGKDYEVADKLVTPSGVLRLLLKSRSGPLTICDASKGGVKCSPVSTDGPKVAAQSVKLLRDEEAIVTGLTEDGRKGFTAKGGELVEFAGAIGGSARNGLVIEQAEGGAGFLALLMKKGKAKGKATFAPKLAPRVTPVSVSSYVSWLETGKDSSQWHFGTVARNKLKSSAQFDGEFAGELSVCGGEKSSVAIWGGSSRRPSAKATKGKETGVYASFLQDDGWSKPVSGEIPFERSVTGSRCSSGALDLFWARSDSGQLEVGQLSCKAAGCDSKSSKWPGFEVKRWIAAGLAGDKFVALWTTSLGETRVRVGAPGKFSEATETILFESHDRGGPLFREAETFFTSQGAYLLVKDAGPILLRLDAKGITALSGK